MISKIIDFMRWKPVVSQERVLRNGDILIVRYEAPLSKESRDSIKNEFDILIKDKGVSVIVLDCCKGIDVFRGVDD